MDSNAPESLESFQEMIRKAANECFQKVKDDTGKNKFKICWWDKDLQKIVKERQAAFLKYMEQPSLENYLTSKRLQAYSKKSIKEKKKESFLQFCMDLNYKSSKHMWKDIKRFRSLMIYVLL
ncbi:hypothetical protein WA026_006619 [Henosepilachna vigintioctopunctata]|uniref:Uncharacterized protein n=1 Tax=Henosepilachna vigintioctopunctata TaxID=420089 RepID=A0AAW1U7C3_9CUCU